MTINPSIHIEGVSKRFKEIEAVSNFSAQIMPGMLTGIVGPDGAGKTTLIRMMAGLTKPDAGKITILGQDIVQNQEALSDLIGYMPQRFGLYEDLSVIENLKLYADLRALNREKRASVFEKLLAFTKLAPFTDRLSGKLSGGMKQKLGLACALLASPKVLLLDEPGVGVDPVSRQDLWRMVEELTNDGMAVIWATAYLDEAEKCRSVLLLNEGELKFSGNPATLTNRLGKRCFLLSNINQGRREALKKLLDHKNIRDGVIQGNAIRLVMREGNGKDDISAMLPEENPLIENIPARFEDAFVDLLGGGPGGTSGIAERTSPIKLDVENVVECTNLTRRFGDFTATGNVSFKVKQGEIFGLLGPNGAGKSTTFNMLCGLLKPSAGSACVAGFDLAHASSQAKCLLGYMAQKFSLYSLLSVKQNLDFFAGVYGLDGAQRRERVDEMIQTFQLEKFLNSAPEQLSLGFKQRLALACALMHRPPVLFLDEPTSGVDPITRREFWMHINGLVQKGVTVLVTTHFMDEAEYCDRVALMYRSKLIALDTPDQLKKTAQEQNKVMPTMEEAFIRLIERFDEEESTRGTS